MSTPQRFLFFLIFCLYCQGLNAQIITTIAGSGVYGTTGDGGMATDATFSNIIGITVDSAGNVYISDRDANRVRKITPDGLIVNFAGGGRSLGDGGPATDALLSQPYSLACDKFNNVFICDQGNSRLRKVDQSGIISTFAGNGTFGATGDSGLATAAGLDNPCGVAVDKMENVFIGSGSGCIRKISATGIITTIAGSDTSGYRGDDGPATAAWLSSAASLAADTFQNVYVADFENNRIRKIDTNGIITTIAGTGTSGMTGDGGPATDAMIHWPTSIACDLEGNVYFATTNQIREVNSNTGIISTVAGGATGGFDGDGGPATASSLWLPQSIAVHGSGNVFIGDYFNYRVREIIHNHAPYFNFGHAHTISICENSSSISLNSMTSARDIDSGQYIFWRVGYNAAHGTVTSSFRTTTTGTLIIPSGLSYTPAAGFSGIDSFTIIVDDGWLADTTKFSVTVIPVYTSSAISGPANLCIGSPQTYVATPAGGGWTVSYGISISSTGLVSGLSAGTSVLTYIASNSCSIDTALFSINVWNYVTPSITIHGLDTICNASLVTFSSSALHGGPSPTYKWYKNGVLSGADSTNYTPSALANGDRISCTFISDAQCLTTPAANSNVINMHVRPLNYPSVSISGYSGALVCQGTPVTLTAMPVSGGYSPHITWLKAGTILGFGYSLIYTPDNGDVVYCDMTSSTPCSLPPTVDAHTEFYVKPVETPFLTIHTPHDSTAYWGEIVTMIAEETFGGSVTVYQWFLNGNPVPGATSNLFSTSVYSNDTILCEATSSLDCITSLTDTSNTIVIHSITNALPNVNSALSLVSLSPNPNNGAFKIAGQITTNNKELEYFIIDIAGHIVARGNLPVIDNYISAAITLGTEIPSGQYLVHFASETCTGNLKFTIMR